MCQNVYENVFLGQENTFPILQKPLFIICVYLNVLYFMEYAWIEVYDGKKKKKMPYGAFRNS